MQPALDSFGCDFQRIWLKPSARWLIAALESGWPAKVAARAMRVLKKGQERYSSGNFPAARSSTLPASSIKRTWVMTAKVELPMAPAFMRKAPPTLPGMPSKNSNPPSPKSRALAATALSFTPGAATQSRAVSFDSCEIRMGQANDHPANAAIANQ